MKILICEYGIYVPILETVVKVHRPDDECLSQ